jgi:hypothetical protein
MCDHKRTMDAYLYDGSHENDCGIHSDHEASIDRRSVQFVNRRSFRVGKTFKNACGNAQLANRSPPAFLAACSKKRQQATKNMRLLLSSVVERCADSKQQEHMQLLTIPQARLIVIRPIGGMLVHGQREEAQALGVVDDQVGSELWIIRRTPYPRRDRAH